jgi:hypothetical protein
VGEDEREYSDIFFAGSNLTRFELISIRKMEEGKLLFPAIEGAIVSISLSVIYMIAILCGTVGNFYILREVISRKKIRSSGCVNISVLCVTKKVRSRNIQWLL